MQFAYEPFILRRTACKRVFFVNAQMPFEFFLSCFQFEQPFFLVSQLEDGRVAVIPNYMCLPWNFAQTGFWPEGLLPKGIEYVTMKKGTYPVIISAHPLNNFEEWFRAFKTCVEPFAKQTLFDFVTSSYEFEPVHFKTEFTKKEKITA